MGKDIIAVPGSIYNFRFEGTNLLIRDGAGILTSLEDLSYYIPQVNNINNIIISDKESLATSKVYTFIKENQPVHLNLMMKEFVENKNLHLEIFELEMKGSIKIGEKGYYTQTG